MENNIKMDQHYVEHCPLYKVYMTHTTFR